MFCLPALCLFVLALWGCKDDEEDNFKYEPQFCGPSSFPTEVTVRGVERIDSSSIRVYCEENRAYLAPYGVGEGKFSIDLPSPNEYGKWEEVADNETYRMYQSVVVCRIAMGGLSGDLRAGFRIGYIKDEDFVGDPMWWLVFFAVGQDTLHVDGYHEEFSVTLRDDGDGVLRLGERGDE